jgi:chromosome segregation ATPase
MMKGRYVAAGIVATAVLLAVGGCNGQPGESAQPSPEVQQLQVSLREAEQQKSQLQNDIRKFQASLNEAESQLAGARQSRDQLQKQVQDLTASQSNLEAKVGELGKARAELENKVDQLSTARTHLEATVAALTKARDAAREDAKIAQAKVDLLNDKLKAQTQQMIELQEQIQSIRAVLEQLQQKLE